jgi:hypothetical protein
LGFAVAEELLARVKVKTETGQRTIGRHVGV